MFKSAQHLNNKHTVFGKLVGGLETLSLMEATPTDDQDRPLKEIKVLSTAVFVDPFEESSLAEEQAEEEKKKKARSAQDQFKEEGERGLWYSHPHAPLLSTPKTGVGKYIADREAMLPVNDQSEASHKRKIDFGASASMEPQAKRPKSDPFSNW